MINQSPRSSRFLGGLALTLLVAAAPGCDRAEQPSPQRLAATPELPADPVQLFVGTCSRCHELAELGGATAESILTATRQVTSMRSLEGRLSDAQRQSLALLIAEETGGAPSSGAPTADGAAPAPPISQH